MISATTAWPRCDVPMFAAECVSHALPVFISQTDKKDTQGNGCLTGFEVLLHKQLKGKQMQKEMAEFVRERYLFFFLRQQSAALHFILRVPGKLCKQLVTQTTRFLFFCAHSRTWLHCTTQKMHMETVGLHKGFVVMKLSTSLLG